MSANSGAEMRLVVEGEMGNVVMMTVLVFRAVVNSVRPGRVAEASTPLRSAMRTVIPRALPMLATRLPIDLLGGGLGREVWCRSCDFGPLSGFAKQVQVQMNNGLLTELTTTQDTESLFFGSSR